MALNYEKLRQNLEEITANAKELRTSLFPVKRKIRETEHKLPDLKLPKIAFLSDLYTGSIFIQRIANAQPRYGDDEENLIRLKGKAIFPLALVLYAPRSSEDAPYNYSTFFHGDLDYRVGKGNSIDILVQAASYPRKRIDSRELPSSICLADTLGHREFLEAQAQDYLRTLQYFHSLNVDPFIEKYMTLLKQIHTQLKEFSELDLKKLKQREIPDTFPNIPISINREGETLKVYRDEEKRIIHRMLKSRDWAASLNDILNFLQYSKSPMEGNLREYRILFAQEPYEPVPNLSPPPKRNSIFGIDNNLQRLEALIRGYADGRSTPSIVLLGEPGVGKSLSLRYVMEVTKDIKPLRYFLMQSLVQIGPLSKLDSQYKPVGVIDDMTWEVNPLVYEKLKQNLEGLEDTLFDRALVIISANSEVWNKLDAPVRQRLGGVELHYKKDEQSHELLVRYFCKYFNVKYRPDMLDQTKDFVPRQVRDYIRAAGSEQAGLLKIK